MQYIIWNRACTAWCASNLVRVLFSLAAAIVRMQVLYVCFFRRKRNPNGCYPFYPCWTHSPNSIWCFSLFDFSNNFSHFKENEQKKNLSKNKIILDQYQLKMTFQKTQQQQKTMIRERNFSLRNHWISFTCSPRHDATFDVNETACSLIQFDSYLIWSDCCSNLLHCTSEQTLIRSQ